MKKKILFIAVVAIALMSWSQLDTTTGEITTNLIPVAIKSVDTDKEGYVLMKNNCYACHNPKATSHDDIIAPPFRAVKMHYTRSYDTKEEFVNAIVDWVQNPTKETALMRGAVNRFNLMPKMPLATKDLQKIASYMYDNDVDQPAWMDKHMDEEHGKGKRKGKGKKGH